MTLVYSIGTAMLITSRKGKEIILFRQYTYRKLYNREGRLRWVCSTQKNCRAAVYTDLNKVITSTFMYKKAYGSQLWYCWFFFSRCCPAKLRIDNTGNVTEIIGKHNHDPPKSWLTPDGKSYMMPAMLQNNTQEKK
ncbi:unnamed protein product [Leptidea sinapis]|uniref:FLYWCH-type domain-containing protein n=1 Tax=Leptidea sinapis TaxID=189913 RepID=A0A5E4PZ14_9NEOP|nr:unnamed protein product [Leptidea sinapis]